MNSALKKLYDFTPAPVQNALLSLFSAHVNRKRYGGRFPEFRALMEEAQWWERSKMVAWQEARLRSILQHAYDNVPYYHDTFRRHGFDPQRFGGLEDLQRIPVLTRDIVKNRGKELISKAFKPAALSEGHTSGTTGSPITLFYDDDMVAMNYAAMDRQYRWAGLRLEKDGSRAAVLRGNVIVPLSQKKAPFWRHNRTLNQMVFSSFHLAPANFEAYLGALRDFDPEVMDGYPSSLYVMAKMLLTRGERLPLKAAITSSETLYDFQRETIEKAFECRVFDYYAAAERVVFSTECSSHQGHHLCEEYGITEVLDENDKPVSPGAEGFLVGTSLHNRGMPLIRYRTTDRTAARVQPCSCGRQLPMMEDVTTKAEDTLTLPDGRLIPPSVLTHPFKPLDTIEASQLIQTDRDRLLVRIVPGGEFKQHHREHLVRELRARLGEDMRIDVECVEDLPRTSRGKFKWVVSQVKPEF